MGSRLGVIVKTHEGWELYYDHWAAQTIGADIALDGHNATLDRVRSMTPIGVDHPEDWAGATWIEGTLLIDETTRTVVWAEESEALYLPRLINYLVEHSWPGWTAVWSPEGTRGTLRSAGVDPSTIFTSIDDHIEARADAPDLYPWEQLHGNDPISARMVSGDLVSWDASAFLDEIADLGPVRFHEIAQEVQTRQSAGSEAWAASIEDDDRATGGVHVDYLNRTIHWWSLSDGDLHIRPFEALWPNWTIQCHGDDYSWHTTLLDRPLRHWQEDVEQCRRRLHEAVAEGRRQNPFEHVAAALNAQGHTVTSLPGTHQFVPANRGRPAAFIDRILDSVMETPLAPARIITH